MHISALCIYLLLLSIRSNLLDFAKCFVCVMLWAYKLFTSLLKLFIDVLRHMLFFFFTSVIYSVNYRFLWSFLTFLYTKTWIMWRKPNLFYSRIVFLRLHPNNFIICFCLPTLHVLWFIYSQLIYFTSFEFFFPYSTNIFN